MSYASVVSSGTKAKSTPNKPAESKQNETQAPQQQATQPEAGQQTQVAAQQTPEPKLPVVVRDYTGNNGGAFSVLLSQTLIINTLARLLSPQTHINLGVTCKNLNRAFLNQNTWNLAQNQLPRNVKPVFRIEVRIPIRGDKDDEDSGFSLDDIEADGLAPEGNSVTVSAGFFRKESRKQQLQKVWRHEAKKLQKARDKQFEEDAKREKDPLLSVTTKKMPFEMKFPGGFVISYREQAPAKNNQSGAAANPAEEKSKKPDTLIASGRDLSDLGNWLDCAQKLLQGDKKMELPTSNAANNLLISRYGRGGSQLVVRAGKSGNKVFFQLADFAIQLRAAAKEFTPVIGRIAMLINQDVKNVPKEESESYLEYEKFFIGAFKTNRITPAIKAIKASLERGVPHSNIQEVLQKKRAKKKQTRAQVDIENSNILDFLYANLPSDLTQARNQAQQQTEEALRNREEAIQQSQAERERRREEKRLKKEADRQKKENKYAEKVEDDEKTPKTKTKVVKTTTNDGFVTLSTTYTKLDEEGKVQKTVSAAQKDKKDEQVNAKDKKKTAAANKPSPAAASVSPTLANNPYAAVKQAEGYDSPHEVKAKANQDKGKLKTELNNEQQSRAGIAPPPAPKSKSKKEVKKEKQAQKDRKEKKKLQEPEPTTEIQTTAINPQQVVIACVALAGVVLSYVFYTM